jgi:16S rRNA processing protein RimM
MEKTISIGSTKKPHGLKGEVKLFVEEKYLEDLMHADIIMIDIRGRQTPFFVEDIRVGNNIIAKFEDINTPEAAMSIAHKEIFLREGDLIPDDEREIEIEMMTYEHCVGYSIINHSENIGIIRDIEEFPQQEMAMLTFKNKEVMIPLHPHFIKKLDVENKTIWMELPEGILDL